MTSPGLVSYQSVTTKRLLFSDPDLLKFDASDFVFRDSNIFSRVVVLTESLNLASIPEDR